MPSGGFKNFSAGEVLTASDVNSFLLQGILVFADATARDAAITSPVAGQFAWLTGTETLTYRGSSSWETFSSGFDGSGGNHSGVNNGFKYHIFTADGTFTAGSAGRVEVLLIGGGASGGRGVNSGGGGGAGGVLHTTVAVSAGANAVVIGAGGTAPGSSPNTGVDGADSTFGGLTAKGGSGGAKNPDAGNSGGGSGGGGASSSSAGGNGGACLDSSGPLGLYDGIGSQGHDGGGGAGNSRAGGGGGAGSPGHFSASGGGDHDTSSTSEFFGRLGSGGIGIRLDSIGAGATAVAGSTIGDARTIGSSTAYYFAAGGGGGNNANSTTVEGAPGGGGQAQDTSSAATDGAANTGSGGGGNRSNGAAGSGGSGLCIIRYPSAS
jgi:hypothetical protein